LDDLQRTEVEHKLILDNRGFVYSMANKYASSGVPFGDLVNAGMLGLIKAAKKYDTSRESKFISFATSWVQHEMIKVIRETRFPCRVPLNLNKAVNKIRRGEGDESSAEFAAIIPLLKTTSEESPASNHTVSFESEVINKVSIQQALATLDVRTRNMVTLYAGLERDALGISEIARVFSLSKQRVRSLICAGLEQLRVHL
jgi:RNA polymerase sigma factor (sigma-70 family)